MIGGNHLGQCGNQQTSDNPYGGNRESNLGWLTQIATVFRSPNDIPGPFARPGGAHLYLRGFRARIEPGVTEIDGQVGHDHRSASKQDNSLHHWNVPVADGCDEEVSDTRP